MRTRSRPAPTPRKRSASSCRFRPGGATDIIARLVGERLSGAWNRPVVIENISGAAGAAGTAAAAKAAPDGYSLLTATGTTTTLLPHLRRNLPTTRCATSTRCRSQCSFTNILVVRPDVPARTVSELIALGAGEPGKIHLRQLRLRRFAASVGRMVQADDQDRHPARALYRQRDRHCRRCWADMST